MEATILDQHEMYYPDLSKQIQELKLYQQERLWYQLGELLLEYTKNDVFQEEDHLIQLYTGFVKQFETKIDQIKLMMFIMKASNQFKSNEESINFLNELKERALKENQAKWLCEIQKGHHQLNLANQEATLTIITQITKNLDQMNTTIEPFVQASLHQLSARYYKFRNNYEKFYLHSLQFLAYTPETDIKQSDKIQISFEMGIAILIAKNMYNFSELLEQPILQTLKDTEYIWIYELLTVFNNGDVNAFNEKIMQYRTQIESFNELASNMLIMQQKIKMMGFLELLFSLPKNDRNVSFSEIAQITNLDIHQVELLIMKAMSLNLIKGNINQVSTVKQMIKVDWVMQRVLDRERIGKMKDKLNSWNQSLSTLLQTLEGQQQNYA